MNRKTFYDNIRERYFPGGLNQQQVDLIEALLDEAERKGWIDRRWYAYMLGTAYHETDGFIALVEYGKGIKRHYGKPDTKTGQTYYGRGPSMLTLKENYERFGERYGLDLLNNPDMVLETGLSARIMVEGMGLGLFTGKKLSDYFPANEMSDWLGARRIINGTDRAQMVANNAQIFYAALLAAETPLEVAPEEPAKPISPPVQQRPIEDLRTEPRPNPTPTASPARNEVLTEEAKPWHSGWKTHLYMAICILLGVLGLLGKMPGLSPETSMHVIQIGLIASGFRSAWAQAIRAGVTFYQRSQR